MRSVFICHPEDSKDAVVTWLNSNLERDVDGHWLYRESARPVLFCYFTGESDWDDEELQEMDKMVPLSRCLLQVDISGSVPGDREVNWLVTALLGAVSGGAAVDDYSASVWVLEEIESGAEKLGHPFFDYRGRQEAGLGVG